LLEEHSIDILERNRPNNERFWRNTEKRNDLRHRSLNRLSIFTPTFSSPNKNVVAPHEIGVRVGALVRFKGQRIREWRLER
jgi:hypothetical protein